MTHYNKRKSECGKKKTAKEKKDELKNKVSAKNALLFSL